MPETSAPPAATIGPGRLIMRMRRGVIGRELPAGVYALLSS